jgi:transposase InsO family protein
MWIYFRLFLIALRGVHRERRDLVLENLALRQQLMVYHRSRRPTGLTAADRRFWATLARRWAPWRASLVVVQPATVVRWHRIAWRRYWTWRSRPNRGGRPRVTAETRHLIQRMARENPTWGPMRIVGELQALGLPVGATTVRRYRREALRRPPSPSWRTFLQLHAPEIWAADFFTVPTLTFRTLYVFFVIAHDRRRIVHCNVTAHPTAPWVWRQIIQATPWNTGPRFLIRDRDTSYGGDFIPKAARLGIQTILTPVHAPKANAIAERVIGTIRRDCLDHLIVVNERHLRRVLREYIGYYNATRPHQTLGLHPPDGPRLTGTPGSAIVVRPVLGGLHHIYERAA